MLILYKNDRNVRFVLFTKTSKLYGKFIKLFTTLKGCVFGLKEKNTICSPALLGIEPLLKFNHFLV